MNLPSLPTDNLYKFIALTGVAIIFTSILFLGSKVYESFNELDTTKSALETLKLEVDFLTEDKNNLSKKIADLRKTTPVSSSSIDPDSAIFKHFVSQSKNLEADKNLREYYEFLFKYEDKVIPQNKKIQEAVIEGERILKLEREVKRKIKQIELKTENFTKKNHRLNFIAIILIILVAVGWRMAVYGFKQWRDLVQKPIDEKLALELENLKKTYNTPN